MKVEAKKVTQSNFQKFGKVVKLGDSEPTSQAADYKFWSNLANYNIDGSTEVGICTVYKQEPAGIDGMERHLNTPEILVPIDAPFVLPVLKEGSGELTEAFIVDMGEAVVINDAVWHGACIPYGKEESSYFVIFKLGTPVEDVEKKDVEKFEVVV